MDQRRTLRTRGEVIEEFARPLHQEVVEVYVRPLPGAPAPEGRRHPPAGAGGVIGVITAPPREGEMPPRQRIRPSRHRVRPKVWRGIALLLAAAGVFSLLTGGARWLFWKVTSGWGMDSEYFYYDRSQERDENAPITIPAARKDTGVRLTLGDGAGAVLTPQEVYEKVSGAVVTVTVKIDENSQSIGTGVLFRSDGYLVTNHHVVAGGMECTILLADGRPFKAGFVASTPDYDLAVLKIEGERFPTAEFCDSDTLVVGEAVYAIGTPLNLDMGGTFTDGIVSSLSREMALTEGGASLPLIQTNTALNNGNSGGPLINSRGQVVGINFMKLSARASTVEGLGFAIPSVQVERVVNDLIATGSVQPEPLLGLMVSQRPEALDEAATLWGIEVKAVTPGGAAERAGVRAGDYILQADGRDVLSSSALLKARWKHRLGEEMTLTVWREGKVLTLTLALTDTAEDAAGAAAPPAEEAPER